jgi:hypothetical protein
MSLNSYNENFFQVKSVENIKTHILCSIFFFENRAFYQIMWETIVFPDRPRMTT